MWEFAVGLVRGLTSSVRGRPQPVARSEAAASLVPVRLIGAGGAGVIEIEMPRGVVVRVDREVDLEVLDRVLAALS